MKVKLLIGRSGPAGSFKPGDVIDVPDAEAKRLFEASPPKAAPVRETVSAERTVKRRKTKD